jgi:pentose-5-phosphate-3-epimerase
MPQNAINIPPSILSANFARLGEQVAEAEHCGGRIHVDVMAEAGLKMKGRS